MGQPAAKHGDLVIGIDTHIVMAPSGTSLTPTPAPHPFTGVIDGNLSADVNIMGRPAATAGSVAENSPAHIPTPPGVSFQKPPHNKATIKSGSPTVRINGRMAARNGDPAETCNDPADSSTARVIAAGTVFIG